MLKNVISYLEQSAERYPDKIGFCDAHEKCTFKEMHIRAKKIGTQIIEALGGEKNKPIAVYMDKSVACLSVFFGIVYSGNFYVPIDVKSPRERVNKIFETLKPAVIYTQEEYFEKANNSWGKLFFVTKQKECNIDELALRGAMERQLDVDPLYVLFTSGSTGVPKGVVVSHKSVIDYTEWLKDSFEFDENTVFGNQAPFYFDNSVLDIYSTIKNAAKLYIITEKLFAFPSELMRYLEENAINTIFWVPSVLISVANSQTLSNVYSGNLKKILFCGEVMPNKQLNVWRRAIPNALYANLYGPTEITDVCSCYIVDRTFNDDEPLPIGHACRNMEIFLLNEDGKLCGEGESGELCVRGTGLAMGYYANSEVGESAFIQNPLNTKWRDFVYRTGDIGKYNQYGELIYIGRKDYQIKRNGYRIELGEIEQAANNVTGVKRACAVYDEEKKKIVLFCMAADISEKDIYMKLKEKLPDYMLPARIVIVEQFLLNANGKIDRKKLQNAL